MELQQCFAAESDKNPPCFDCSICLDFASDPVVTLCGHLYCWPCIYKWFDSRNTSLSDERPQCPVCKTEISEKTMIPLYGRGKSFSETESEGEAIPPRPSACNIKTLIDTNRYDQEELVSSRYVNRARRGFSGPVMSYGEGSFSRFNLCGTAAVSLFHPTAGVFGRLIYAGESLYGYPDSYQSAGNRSVRMRRRELRMEESLNRVTVFLFCFLVLCLAVF